MRMLRGRGLMRPESIEPKVAPHSDDVEEQLFFLGGPDGGAQTMGLPLPTYEAKGGHYVRNYQSDGPLAFSAYDWAPDA